MSAVDRRHVIGALFIILFAAIMIIAYAATADGWEGDDGGLDSREADVGRWVDATNRAIWRAEEQRQIEEFQAAAAAYAQAARAQQQMQLTTPPTDGIWDRLADCESGGDWGISTGNGFYGGLQFTLTSWRAVGGTGYPHHHSREEQIHRGQLLQDIQGWGAWPACSRQLGLR